MSPKIRKEKLYRVSKCYNTLKWYTLKALLSKNWFYVFFLIFSYAKIPPSFTTPRCWH